MNEFSDFLSLLSEVLLVVALPIVIAAAIQHLRVKTQELRASMSKKQQEAVDQAIALAKKAIHTGALERLAGPERRQQAIQIVQSALEGRGVRMNVGRLASLVETEILAQLGQPTMPNDMPEARQALIDKAVESAVLAAEQSGLSGLIENVGVEKKAYALRMAATHLGELGVTVPPGLLGGLIEAHLLRLFLAARRELPTAPKSE